MSSPASFLSGYRIMWILVMFDLPTDTKPQRKEANTFRNFLLDEGFERSQFSAYARFVNGKEAFATKIKRIERNLPSLGDIQVLNFTDRRHRDVVRFSDQGRLRKSGAPAQAKKSGSTSAVLRNLGQNGAIATHTNPFVIKGLYGWLV